MTVPTPFDAWVAAQQARHPTAPQPVFLAALGTREAYFAALAIAQTTPPPDRTTNEFVIELTKLIADTESEIKADSAEKAALRRQIEVLTREKAELSAEVQSLKDEIESLSADDDEEEEAAAESAESSGDAS